MKIVVVSYRLLLPQKRSTYAQTAKIKSESRMQRHRGHCSSRRLFCFLLVNILITLHVTASKVELSLTKDKPVQSFDALNGVTYTICSTQRTEFDLKSIFHQLVVVVVGPDDHKLPWHSVKGLSTDDSHTYIENLMLPFFGTDEDVKAKNSKTVEFTSSFVRDIVSACPSPIFHSTRSKCSMSFSPFGTACVQLRSDKTIRLTATSERQFNPWLPANMFCGLFLLYLSQSLSKSSIFQVCTSSSMITYFTHTQDDKNLTGSVGNVQKHYYYFSTFFRTYRRFLPLLPQYSSGVLLFVVGGFLVISFFISKRAVFGGRNQPHVTQLTGMSALLAGSYGASTVWFLRSYLRTICLKYAEFALVRILSKHRTWTYFSLEYPTNSAVNPLSFDIDIHDHHGNLRFVFYSVYSEYGQQQTLVESVCEVATASIRCNLRMEINCIAHAFSNSHGSAARNLCHVCLLEGSQRRQKQENGVETYFTFTHNAPEVHRPQLIVYRDV